MLLKITHWMASSEILSLSRAFWRHSSFTQTEHRRPCVQGAHSHSDSHSYICMHEGTQPHTHMPDRALTTHPLSGTQQGDHVLVSEGATSLQQPVHTLSFLGDIYQCRLVALLIICVHIFIVCLCSRACQTQWNHSFHDKCGISWQPQPLWCVHLWCTCLTCPDSCFPLCQMAGPRWGHLFS